MLYWFKSRATITDDRASNRLAAKISSFGLREASVHLFIASVTGLFTQARKGYNFAWCGAFKTFIPACAQSTTNAGDNVHRLDAHTATSSPDLEAVYVETNQPLPVCVIWMTKGKKFISILTSVSNVNSFRRGQWKFNWYTRSLRFFRYCAFYLIHRSIRTAYLFLII